MLSKRSASKHLAEAQKTSLRIRFGRMAVRVFPREKSLNNRKGLSRGIRKKSFPRDSSATLGMTENKTLGMTHHTVMLSKRSASKHLAEALIE